MWRDKLSACNCIYVISDSNTGKLYVGSTYNSRGIWGRWEEYAKTGHGGDVELKKLLAEDPNYGNAFLGGQNDVAVFAGMTDSIVWQNATIYDQACNEGYQDCIKGYIDGSIDKDTALQNFYSKIREQYPSVTTP